MSGIDLPGPTSPGPLSPGDAVVQQRKDAIQATTAPTGDGGLFSQLASNPFFTAGFGLAGLTVGARFAQQGLRHGVDFIRRRMLVEVEITHKDDSYKWFLNWMRVYQQGQLYEAQSAASRSGFVDSLLRKLTPSMRHFSMETKTVTHSNGAINTHFAMVPGLGRHVLRYNNAFIFVNRQRESRAQEQQTGRPWETMTLTTLYSQRHVFQEMFTEAHAYVEKIYEGKTSILRADVARWEPLGNPRRKRPLDSVILDKGVKERIVDDVKDFLSSEKWYYDRGIPYRRGYLLYGPPGTGKSSFIQAVAGELNYNIALLNLSERGLTDDRLNRLLTVVPKRTIVLLEDVDAAFANRRVQSDEDGYQGANVTFSGLLNALDGVASAEERIIFLTTNHVDRLDEALVRPGRVDMTVRIGEITRYQVGSLWDRFYGDLDTTRSSRQAFLNRLQELGLIEDENGHKADRSTSTSAAALQGLFLYNKDNMEGAIAMAEGLTYRLRDHAVDGEN
ncbi:BCS1 N terminal-domain-containing protein [Aspergillus karnatakaensis]|uniref:bifunctional AAA family ATPase chaperone/translocase BCS1 n=1 Tax=Aspergillus karnatakaensis TaxID=1810916 RepID=UPI003CCDD5C2